MRERVRLPARAERIARAVAVAAGAAVRARATVATLARGTLATLTGATAGAALTTRRAVTTLAPRRTIRAVATLATRATLAIRAVAALTRGAAETTLTTRRAVTTLAPGRTIPTVAALAPRRTVAALARATIATAKATTRATAVAAATWTTTVAAAEAALTARWARRAVLALATLASTASTDVSRRLARLEQRPPREVDPALAIDLGHQHRDLVADVHHVLDARHPIVGKLGDVNQPLLARQDLDEGAERHQAGHLAGVDRASLDVLGEALDPVDRLPGVVGVVRADQHGAIVRDVDGALGLVDDLADHLAAWPDDIADAIWVDLDLGDARRVRRQLGARALDRREHLAHDEQPALASLGQGTLHDLGGDAAHLNVHLARGDALLGAGDLEIHVAEGIFETLDVGQDGVVVPRGDEAHRDARDRRRDRDACIHQRQGAAADAAHRSRAIRGDDLGHDPQCVGEFGLRRQHGHQGALGEGAVADVAPTRTAHRASLANRVGREVVMVDVALRLVQADAVGALLVGLGAEGRNRQDLGLATGKERRAMHARQDAGLAAHRPDLGGA